MDALIRLNTIVPFAEAAIVVATRLFVGRAVSTGSAPMESYIGL
jgi:hypothetical protein